MSKFAVLFKISDSLNIGFEIELLNKTPTITTKATVTKMATPKKIVTFKSETAFHLWLLEP